jgi:LAS superfamily LD-carboxypeptidase LdcB
MEYPVLPVILPKDLEGQPNGKLPDSLLRPVQSFPKGRMHHIAATAYNALVLHAYFNGVELKPTSAGDCYRTYDSQKSMFDRRYQTSPSGRSPEITRKFEGNTYYLKKGVAPSASPGTSNHGLGLAVDISNASGDRLKWMIGDGFMNCPVLRYGFSWEVKSGAQAESWHIRYVCGDKLPDAVLEALQAFPNLKA